MKKLQALVAVLALVLTGIVAGALPAAAAADAAIRITPLTPTASPATQDVGETFLYRVDYTCLQCTDVTIAVPLGSATMLQVAAQDDQGAAMPVTVASGVATIAAAAVDGSRNLTLVLRGTVGTTPDGTTWTLTPTLTASGLAAVSAPTPVTGTYTAPFVLSAKKVGPATAQLVGDTYSYNISVACGQRYAQSVTITDTLPEGLDFVSANAGGTYAPGAGTVTWNLTGAELGGSCGDAGQVVLTVTVQARADVLAGASSVLVTNAITVDGTSADGVQRRTTAEAVTRIVAATEYPAGTFGKSVPKRQIFAGGDVEYQLRVAQPRDGYRAEIVDPMPCLSELTDTTYDSPAPQDAAAAQAPACASPLVHVTSISLGATPTPSGWAPRLRLTDGTITTLAGPGPWSVDSSLSVAEVIVPEIVIPNSTDEVIVIVQGTMDTAVPVGSTVRNTAHATFIYPDDSREVIAASNTNEIIAPIRSWASKSLYSDNFSDFTQPYGAIVGGSIEVTGDLTVPVTITDLLPAGHVFRADQPAAVEVYLDGWHTIATTIESLDDFAGTGRSLVRASIPAAALNALVPAGTSGPVVFDLSVRFSAQASAPGEFQNASQIFSLDAATTAGCSPAGGDNGVYVDDLDLDGSPETTVACESAATLTLVAPVTNSGFTVTKLVRGDHDSGYSTSGVFTDPGTADYRLTWANTSANPLADPVMYDVLPHVGDTTNAGDDRGSQFSVHLTGAATASAGVAIAYSTATNPCRPEVRVDPTCADDWSTTLPTNAADVTGLRFTRTGVIASGGVFTADVPVGVDGATGGQRAWNTAVANATLDGLALLPYESPAVSLRPSSPELVIRKTAPEAIVADQGIAYNVTVFNDGTAPADAVTIVDTLPAGLIVIDPDGGTIGVGTITWSGLTIPVGGSTSFLVRAQLDETAADDLVNRAAVTSAHPVTSDTPCADDATVACASTHVFRALEIIKTVDRATAVVGDELTYTLTVPNPRDVVQRVSVADFLPAGVEFVSATGNPVDPGDGATPPPFAGVRIWGMEEPIEITPTSVLTLTVVVRVTDGSPGDVITNAAYGVDQYGVPMAATTTPCSGELQEALGLPMACATTTIVAAAPQLSLTKEVCVATSVEACDAGIAGGWASSSTTAAGASAYWRLTVHNAGNIALTAIDVSDALPASLGTPGAVTSTAGSADAFPAHWTIPTLGVDATEVLTFRTAAPITAGEIVNTAAATAEEVDAVQARATLTLRAIVIPGGPGLSATGVALPLGALALLIVSVTVGGWLLISARRRSRA